MIYLDYNATTPVDKGVFKAMKPFLKKSFGNPSNSYALGLNARDAVLIARQRVANLINGKSSEIYFTGCGSESNNTVIKGIAFQRRDEGKHIISTVIEHPSVLEPLRFLEKNGFEVTYVPVDNKGTINPEDIARAIREDTILVSVMHANNEVGTLQPIKDIGRICRKRKVIFHTDASQAVGKVPIDVNTLNVDLLTLAGHKLYAPKGIGALYIREGISVEPLVHGASQEHGQRAGTENVPYIVGLGKAAILAYKQLETDNSLSLKKYFYQLLVNAFGDNILLNGDFINSLPNTLNISFLNNSGFEILSRVPQISASTGSACHSGNKAISPVLKAMGISESVAYGAIRFSIGRFTTKDQLEMAVEILEKKIKSK